MSHHEYKQIIIIRTDLKMGTGKKCVQCSHASVSASNLVRMQNKNVWKKWMDSGQPKIALKVGSLEELEIIHGKVLKEKIPCFLIQDAGLTQLEPGTVTALGIGPAESIAIDKICGNLKLL